jgi:uncharacterized coiled-coil protein SlyX
MTQAIIVALIGGLLGGGAVAALMTGLFQRQRTHAEGRKANADADHQTVDAANDVIALVRQVYEERIKAMEADIALDRRTIIELNRRLGNVMQAAEVQSKQIQLWRERVEELLCILRANGIPLPRWAQPGACGDE